MADESKICSICGRKQGVPGTGSFTQWLSICRCDQLKKGQAQVLVCANCGRPISKGDTGSFTQWVFRPKTCSCENPVSKPAPDQLRADHSTDQQVASSDSVSVESDSAKFPLERYQPIRQLGSGGIGTVYLCFDKRLQKEVAVKVLRVASEEQLVAFQTEARVTAKLNHPSIVSILDFGVTDHGAPYMVLEHVQGTPLDRLMAQAGHLNEQMVVALSIPLLDALEHAHATGIFHRDIKTSNILVAENTRGDLSVHIIDFGIAFLEGTRQGVMQQGKTLVGTPRYMSPDQLLGKRFDARSEVYSVGCLLYEMLSGRVPFNTEDPLALLEMHASKAVPPFSEICPELQISARLGQIVFKCLEKDPESRFQSMQALSKELQSLSWGTTTHFNLSPNTVATRTANNAGRIGWRLLVPVTVILLVACTLSIRALNNDRKAVIEEQISPSSNDSVPLKKLKNPKVSEIGVLPEGFERDNQFGAEFWVGKSIRDDDLHRLFGSSVKNLSLEHDREITARGVEILTDLPLQKLILRETRIGDESINSINKMNLDLLDLRGTNVTDEGLRQLRPSTKLRLLDLDYLSKVTDEGLKEVIEKFPNLSYLNVSNTKVTTAGLRHLKKLSLETLAIASLQLQDEDMDLIADLKPRGLDLESNKITDKSIKKILAIPGLRWVKVDFCEISPKGQAEFKKRFPMFVYQGVKPARETVDVMQDLYNQNDTIE